MLVSSFRVEFEDFRRKGYDAVKIRNFIYESFVLVCYFKSIQMRNRYRKHIFRSASEWEAICQLQYFIIIKHDNYFVKD